MRLCLPNKATLIIVISVLALGYSAPKRIYVTTFKSPSAASSIGKSLPSAITVKVVELSKNSIQAYDDATLSHLFKMAALQEAGFAGDVSEDWLGKRADLTKADTILSGIIANTGKGLYSVQLRTLNYNKKTGEVTPGDAFSLSMAEEQLDWYATEIAKRVLDSSYTIRTAPEGLKINVKVDLSPFLVNKVETRKDLSIVLDFGTENNAVSEINKLFLREVGVYDELLNKRRFQEARGGYIILYSNHYQKALSPELRAKVPKLEPFLKNRLEESGRLLGLSYLREADKQFVQTNLLEGLSIYLETKRRIIALDNPPEPLMLVRSRISNIGEAIVRKEILVADTYFLRKDFKNAFLAYYKARDQYNWVDGQQEFQSKHLLNEIDEKSRKANLIGFQLFKNRVLLDIDRLQVLNLSKSMSTGDSKASQDLVTLKNELFSYIRANSYSTWNRPEIEDAFNNSMTAIGESHKFSSFSWRARVPEEETLVRLNKVYSAFPSGYKDENERMWEFLAVLHIIAPILPGLPQYMAKDYAGGLITSIIGAGGIVGGYLLFSNLYTTDSAVNVMGLIGAYGAALITCLVSDLLYYNGFRTATRLQNRIRSLEPLFTISPKYYNGTTGIQLGFSKAF